VKVTAQATAALIITIATFDVKITEGCYRNYNSLIPLTPFLLTTAIMTMFRTLRRRIVQLADGYFTT
jgi:hypothetical protein